MRNRPPKPIDKADQNRSIAALEKLPEKDGFIGYRTRAFVYLLLDGALRTGAAVFLNAEEVVKDPNATRVHVVEEPVMRPCEGNKYRERRRDRSCFCAALEQPGADARRHQRSSYAPAGSRVAQRKAQSPRAPALSTVAQQLRRVDPGRAGLYAADAAVRAGFGDDVRARHYMERVARARHAEQRAKARFVTANLRLVIAMAQRYRRSQLPIEDLIQEGNLGLLRAVERFDHRRGYRFSTYAAWWIRHGLSRAVSDKARLVRIPVHALDGVARVARAHDLNLTRTGAAPSLQELAAQTGIAVPKLAQLRQDARRDQPLSLDQNLADDGKNLHDRLSVADSPDPEQAIDLASWHERLPGDSDEVAA
jgi:RNA polymerase sigma factor (sigma-70 family)